MKIGEVAQASGCPIETIRYYERVGLATAPPRADNGYRAYESRDVDRLRFITRGRALGFGLEEIRSLLALAEDSSLGCDDVDQLARHHLEEIRIRMRELGRMARELERTISACHHGKRAHCSILQTLNAPGVATRRRNATAHV